MIKTPKIHKNAYLHAALGFLLCGMMQSCFPESELFVNIASSKNVPINVVLPIIYRGDIPIKTEELHNSEKYSLLGNCTQNSNEKKDPKKTQDSNTADEDGKSTIEINATENTGTSIPLFIVPTKGHRVVNEQVQQVVYLIPQPLGAGEHYCLNIAPMYKETQNMDAVTQALNFEFDTVGKKLIPDSEYGGPQYSDPDIFSIGFPTQATTEDQENYTQAVSQRASMNFPPILKFSKSGMSNDAFAADPEKIRDSIEICRILTTKEWKTLTSNSSNTLGEDRKCSAIDGFQVKMIEDLAYDESGRYILANYDYFSITGGALKPGNAYQIKVMYNYGENKENLSDGAQEDIFMMVDDDQIIQNDPEEKISAKTFFDAFKFEQDQVPGDSYIEIPIRSKSSNKKIPSSN